MKRTEKHTSVQLNDVFSVSITTGTVLRATGELFEAGPINRNKDRLCQGCGEVLEDRDTFNCDDCAETLFWEAQAREDVALIDQGGYATREEETEPVSLTA